MPNLCPSFCSSQNRLTSIYVAKWNKFGIVRRHLYNKEERGNVNSLQLLSDSPLPLISFSCLELHTMNSTLKDAQAPSHRECLLPSVARTPSVTQITPAKKITFLKRGDPRFAGVRLAVDQRAFKSFGALMDELSQRMPLSFGVRSVTTPRGLHGLSALEQLEDGGCYLCSDKKPPKTPGGPGWTQGRNSSAQRSRDFESRSEAPGTSSSCKGSKAPRRIMLVKNGDPRFQQMVVLSHRNTKNLTAFLSKASDLLRFPVKQVYTTNGEKVGCLGMIFPLKSSLAFRSKYFDGIRGLFLKMEHRLPCY